MVDTFYTFLDCGVAPQMLYHGQKQYSLTEVRKLSIEIAEELAKKIGKNSGLRFNFEKLESALGSNQIFPLDLVGRGAKFSTPKDVEIQKKSIRNIIADYKKQNPQWHFYARKLYNINGEVFIVNDYEQEFTGIKLNIRNSDKRTAPFNNFIHQK